MTMTPQEAAAIALALAAFETPDINRGAADLYRRPAWSTIDDPRTWLEVARREAVGLDADV